MTPRQIACLLRTDDLRVATAKKRATLKLNSLQNITACSTHIGDCMQFDPRCHLCFTLLLACPNLSQLVHATSRKLTYRRTKQQVQPMLLKLQDLPYACMKSSQDRDELNTALFMLTPKHACTLFGYLKSKSFYML